MKNKFDAKIFAKRLKELRKEVDISTTTLGNVLNVKNSTISRWENEKIIPSIEHLYNLSKFFNVSADYLLGLED